DQDGAARGDPGARGAFRQSEGRRAGAREGRDIVAERVARQGGWRRMSVDPYRGMCRATENAAASGPCPLIPDPSGMKRPPTLASLAAPRGADQWLGAARRH